MKFKDFMDELTELVMIIGGILFLVPPFAIVYIVSLIANFHNSVEFSLDSENQSSLLIVKKDGRS